MKRIEMIPHKCVWEKDFNWTVIPPYSIVTHTHKRYITASLFEWTIGINTQQKRDGKKKWVTLIDWYPFDSIISSVTLYVYMYCDSLCVSGCCCCVSVWFLSTQNYCRPDPWEKSRLKNHGHIHTERVCKGRGFESLFRIYIAWEKT